MKIKPRLFISYSRKDGAFAEVLNKYLNKSGYQTFFDAESIEVGEIFPMRIISSIKKSDGCIVIVSSDSVESEWCKLEAYYAHFYKKLIIPVKKGAGEYDFESPLRYIEKDIHYAVIDDAEQPEKIMAKIKRGLDAAAIKARMRVLKITGIVTVVSISLVGIFMFGVRNINKFVYKKDAEEFLQEVKKSDKIFRAKEIDLYRNKFNNDHEIVASLHLFETDPGLSDIARINSKIMSAALLQSYNLATRQFYKNIDWKLSTIESNIFANATFSNGNISQVNFKNVEFSDVLFNGIREAEKGIKLSGNQFINCAFNAVYFDDNNAIDLQFKACRFRGAFLNTTDFGAVVFSSDTIGNSSVITNGKVTYFENCIFENNNEPDPPGVMVLGKEEEMQFIDVVFEKCRFIGLVRTEWFKNCFFNDCIFPNGFDENSLQQK